MGLSPSSGFMGRILSVVGTVSVPAYDETVTAENLNERLDFLTHQVKPSPGTGRKDFVAALAEVVMRKLLDAPAWKWERGRLAFPVDDAELGGSGVGRPHW